MAEAVHLTPAGLKALEEKLEYLKTTRRAEIADDIAVARSFGDLSENAEYDAAKNEQAHNELEIMEIEAMLKNAVIIDESNIDSDTVSMGSLVRVKFLDMDFEDEYKLVGSAEADMDAEPKRISNDSPVGNGLLGKSVGDTVEIDAPGGLVRVQVVAISR
ncbi:MAG: transcription elongation factor GreA [Christensenellaceae bacterium]|nr:transcription elongation factor GreA [Christensenellaceae bacterium]